MIFNSNCNLLHKIEYVRSSNISLRFSSISFAVQLLSLL
nr:MAG TPA: hypothetical protein [Caudoviricetes sp.]